MNGIKTALRSNRARKETLPSSAELKDDSIFLAKLSQYCDNETLTCMFTTIVTLGCVSLCFEGSLNELMCET